MKPSWSLQTSKLLSYLSRFEKYDAVSTSDHYSVTNRLAATPNIHVCARMKDSWRRYDQISYTASHFATGVFDVVSSLYLVWNLNIFEGLMKIDLCQISSLVK